MTNNIMKSFSISALAILSLSFVGCSDNNSGENSSELSKSMSIDEINSKRGDACECIESTLEKIDAFTVKMNEGVFLTSSELNSALIVAMEGCMTPTGHNDADAAWSLSMSGCENFMTIRNSMIVVSEKAAVLKKADQDAFFKSSGGDTDASEILDRLSSKKKK
jgi:hypothetical protein|tara:strand:+ start:402 stop:893 length:492 start_codon:yes stop_codon:yes gene_type:complete